MMWSAAQRGKAAKSAGIYMAEMGLYAVLMAGYFLFVLHYLGGWLKQLFDGDRVVYAIMALALIVGQGIMLELITTALLRLLHHGRQGG